MKRRTLEQGLELVRKFEASGLSQARFASQGKVSVVALRYWLRKSRQGRGRAKAPVRFVELAEGSDNSGTPIVIVRLSRLPTAAYLAELLFGICRA